MKEWFSVVVRTVGGVEVRLHPYYDVYEMAVERGKEALAYDTDNRFFTVESRWFRDEEEL